MWHHPTLVPFWLKVVSFERTTSGAHGTGGHPGGQFGGIQRVPFRADHLLGGHWSSVLFTGSGVFCSLPHPCRASFLLYHSKQVGTACEEGPEIHQSKEESFLGTFCLPGLHSPKFRRVQAQSGPKGIEDSGTHARTTSSSARRTRSGEKTPWIRRMKNSDKSLSFKTP